MPYGAALATCPDEDAEALADIVMVFVPALIAVTLAPAGMPTPERDVPIPMFARVPRDIETAVRDADPDVRVAVNSNETACHNPA